MSNLTAKGFTELNQVLATMQKKTAKAAMRKAARAGITIIKPIVKADEPVGETGLLKKAVDLKVANKGMSFFGVTGADVAKLQAAHTIDGHPTNIDWLVNHGHVAPNGRFVPPSAHTIDVGNAAQPAASAKMEEVLADQIERWLPRD